MYQVIVNCPSAGCEQKFRCGQWLARNEGDGLIERTLYETSRKMREKSTLIRRFTDPARILYAAGSI